MSVRFRHESGAYADLDAGGACIGILCNDAAKMRKFPVEIIDPEVRIACRARTHTSAADTVRV